MVLFEFQVEKFSSLFSRWSSTVLACCSAIDEFATWFEVQPKRTGSQPTMLFAHVAAVPPQLSTY